MRNSFFIIIIVMAVIFSVVSDSVCTVLRVEAGKPACEKKRLLEEAVNKTIPKTCRLAPCHHQKGQAFILPEALSQRGHDPKRGYFSSLGITVGTQADAASVSFRIGRFPLKQPPSFNPPPLFSLHCAYLC